MCDLIFTDSLGVPFKVGTRVIVGDAQDADAYGRVLQISDPDGDVDDEGRSVYYPPRVTIRYDSDGTEEVFSCYSDWRHGGWEEHFGCDDIEVDTRMLPALTNCDPADETTVAA